MTTHGLTHGIAWGLLLVTPLWAVICIAALALTKATS